MDDIAKANPPEQEKITEILREHSACNFTNIPCHDETPRRSSSSSSGSETPDLADHPAFEVACAEQRLTLIEENYLCSNDSSSTGACEWIESRAIQMRYYFLARWLQEKYDYLYKLRDLLDLSGDFSELRRVKVGWVLISRVKSLRFCAMALVFTYAEFRVFFASLPRKIERR